MKKYPLNLSRWCTVGVVNGINSLYEILIKLIELIKIVDHIAIIFIYVNIGIKRSKLSRIHDLTCTMLISPQSHYFHLVKILDNKSGIIGHPIGEYNQLITEG